MTIFNSLDARFKIPTGPLKNGEKLFLRIEIPKYYHPWEVKVIFNEFMEQERVYVKNMEYEGDNEESYIFKLETNDLEINIYHYYFSFSSFGQTKFIKMCDNSWKGQVLDYNASSNWQLTVYKPISTHPIMKKGVMYQIFPDRFKKSGLVKDLPQDRIYRNWGETPYNDERIGSDFMGGDLIGIKEEVPRYLKKLYVSALYLNPICESQTNHRYATGDYRKIDPVLGTIKDFKELTRVAHSNGMIVILDLVLNHTGSDSIYFNKNNRYPNEGAYNIYDSPYHDWYFFDGDNEHYDSWWGHKTLPKVNQDSKSFLKFVFEKDKGLIYFYLKDLDIDGFRVDVADEQKNHFLVNLYLTSKEIKGEDIVICLEVWENASNKVNYGHRMNYLLGEQATSIMNYPVKNALLEYVRYGGKYLADVFKRTLISIFIEDYPKEIAHSLMNFLSTHDTVRALTKLVGPEVGDHNREWQDQNDYLTPEQYRLGRKKLLLCYLTIFFLPGIPCIYYGDEIGMYGMTDSQNRKCFKRERIDKKMLRPMRSFGKYRKTNEDFMEIADFDVCDTYDDKYILIRYSENEIMFLICNITEERISFDSIGYISNYLKNNGFDKEYDFKMIYNLHRESFETSIGSYGAIIVKGTVKN